MEAGVGGLSTLNTQECKSHFQMLIDTVCFIHYASRWSAEPRDWVWTFWAS